MAWLRIVALGSAVLLIGCGDNEGMGGPNLHLPDSGGGMCGATMCGSSQSCCGGACIGTTNDVANCGGCNIVCATTRADSCAGGMCRCGSTAQCSSSENCCGGTCKDTQSDDANCGTCGHACGQNERCSSGSCVSTLCNGQPCDFLCCGGNTCADIAHDNNNCGQCGKVCNAAIGESCQPQGNLGSCVVLCGGSTCTMGQGCCSNTCTDLTFNDSNCGSCGNACNANTEICLNGCCTDFNTLQCRGGDGGIPFPDGGFPFPDGGFPFPDGFPFPFDAGTPPVPDAGVRDGTVPP
jgi:hypothetical protein